MKCHKEATLNEPKTSPTIYAIYMVYMVYIYDPSETSTQSKTASTRTRTLQAEAFAMSQRKHWSLLSPFTRGNVKSTWPTHTCWGKIELEEGAGGSGSAGPAAAGPFWLASIH